MNNNNRWIINRAGLINFWYYDDEEFHFSDGKLLLRGTNGSGKSVTMQSFIPLLLDGNKSPERMDPFGSKARRLENYLLDEDERNKEESTAYLYMEFKKETSENYLTVGLGFKAQRGKPLKSWGFAITDGRRIGHDFYLYKDMGDKLPLSKKELENRIGSGGLVKEGQGDYMKMVNSLLFGFEDIEEYDELVKLLVQLRSPKLSKDFKPTVVYEIMENSLQQLSEDDLRPMSEAIENMDNIKSRLEELKDSKKAAERVKDAYDKYNRYILWDKAKTYTASAQENDRLLKEQQNVEESRDASKRAYEEAAGLIAELKLKKTVAEEKKKELDVHDSVKIKEKILEIDKVIKNLTRGKEDKGKYLDGKKARETQLFYKIKEHKGWGESQLHKIKQTFAEMDALALEFAFDEHSFMKAELSNEVDKAYNYSYIKNTLKGHIKGLEEGRDALAERDRKNSWYDKVLRELAEAKHERDLKKKRLDETIQFLAEIKEELVEQVYTWKKGNEELVLSEEVMVALSRAINNFSEESSFADITAIVREEFQQREEIFTTEVLGLKFRLDGLEQNKRTLEEHIQEWKNRKEVEPERDEKVIRNRKRLAENNIPYIPLYKAVDFKEELPEEIKGRLEEALLDMGLLDALVIPAAYQKLALQMDREMGDKYIFSSPHYLVHELSQYLTADQVELKGISLEDIDGALKSILIDEGTSSVYINEAGEYGIGILKGKTSGSYSPKFIGATARKRFREEMVQNLNIELLELEREIKGVVDNLEELSTRIRTLKQEHQAFPNDKDLKVAVNELRDCRFSHGKAEEEVGKREGEEKRIYDELKELNQRVHELTRKLTLKAYLNIYEEAIAAAGEYKEFLYQLENFHGGFIQNLETVKGLAEEQESIRLDVENLSGELGILERKLKEEEATHSALNQQLLLSNYEEIKQEIDECLRLLDELPGQIEEEIKREAQQREICKRAVEELAKLAADASLQQKVLTIYEEAFLEEFGLNYLSLQDLGDVSKNAKLVLREIKLQDRWEKDDYIRQLYGKFTENTQYLREYLLKMDSIFEKSQEEENGELGAALAKSKRVSITGKVRGKDVDFYKLLDFIKEGIEENERLLRESDRQLFEDILVKNISKKIRAKIYHSDVWVNRMNQLMENMNTSSGLSFSLRWTSKKAESEGQLDTKELIELLKQEGNLLKESDLNKLSEHFRSKIAEARRIQEDLGKSQSFHHIMREILDYRKWFEFKLSYKKTGEAKKELTNNAFYQFSGGEKAMAMYVPLFSAVYARYEGAGKNCPRLISLDEAFAGVDENNIRDMFRLLHELNLDFIINSQNLWGDYDTVPALSISELIRPDNAKFVTVIRYHWNGRVKELVV